MTPKQRKAKTAYERERRRLHRLHRFEYAARERGFSLVGGIDEVGRGPLAGPVVAACVVATDPLFIKGLNDSKQVRPETRVEIAEIVKVRATAGRSAAPASPRSIASTSIGPAFWRWNARSLR